MPQLAESCGIFFYKKFFIHFVLLAFSIIFAKNLLHLAN